MANQLCWSCKKACGGCNWSRWFWPIAGWTATLSILRDYDRPVYSYAITACPEFVLDRWAEERKGRKDSKLDPEKVWEMICSGVAVKDIARIFDVPYNTACGWRKRLIKKHKEADDGG